MVGTFGSGIGFSIDAEIDRVREEARNRYDALVAQHAEEVSVLEAEIERLQADCSGTLRTRFGACPEKPGGATLSAQQRVVDKWGKGAACRVFRSTEVVERHPDVSILHVSWKPTLAQITEPWVNSVCAALLPGDVVEVWHELDKKISDGVLTKADGEARKNKFFDIVTKVRPDLKVADTRTGWSFDPKSGKDPRAIKVKAHILGVDCDGVRPTKLPYTNYQDETRVALEIIEEDNLYEMIAIPEYGCPRILAEDPDGVERAKYHDFYCDLWSDSEKVYYVTLYEYNSSPNYALWGVPEMSGFMKWVTTS